MEKLIFMLGLISTVCLAILKLFDVLEISFLLVIVPLVIGIGINVLIMAIGLLILFGDPLLKLKMLKMKKERKR